MSSDVRLVTYEFKYVNGVLFNMKLQYVLGWTKRNDEELYSGYKTDGQFVQLYLYFANCKGLSEQALIKINTNHYQLQ